MATAFFIAAAGGGGGPPLSNVDPLPDAAVADPGVGVAASREDHVHEMTPALSDVDPLPDAAVADPGVSTEASRSDHVHPESASAVGGLPIVVVGASQAAPSGFTYGTNLAGITLTLDAAPTDGDLVAVLIGTFGCDIDGNGNNLVDPTGSGTGILTLPGHPTADEVSTYTFMFSAALGATWVIVNRQPLVYGTTKVLPHASTHEPGGTDPVSFGLPLVVAVASQPAPKGFTYFTGNPGVTFTLDLAPADGDLVAFLLSAESVTIAGNGNAIEQPDGSGGASLALAGSAFIPEAAIYTFVFFTALGWFIVNRQPVAYGTTRILDATVENGIMASAVQAQGQSPLTVDVSEVTTVGLANDVVTLDQGRPGRTQTVLNFGANTLQVFPFLGDDIGFGVNVSTTQAAGDSARYLCYLAGFLKKNP